MARLKIKLSRNLRRSIARGHPWVYRDGVANPPQTLMAQLAQVSDAKGELAWAIYDPHGPLALRILSMEKAPPNASWMAERFAGAYRLRRRIAGPETNAYRLFNGEGDRLPGLVCDVYDRLAVLQFDGQGPSEFWDRQLIANWLLANTECVSVVEKTRRSAELAGLGGEVAAPERVILENGVKFHVNIEKGQKTGFFLDQRDNRNYVRSISRDQSVLNLFSYSGGFSMYAGLGAARKVASLDISRGAIDLANENWRLNALPANQHVGLCEDVFDYLKNTNDEWDHVIVDPPSMSHSEDQRTLAKNKYIELFHQAARRVASGGELSLSSCSSHVSFEDFFEIITEALSLARRRGRILRISGQGADHPFPQACFELRYLKFVHLVLDS